MRTATPRGELRRHPGNILVDSRRPDDTKTYHLDDFEWLLYSACDDLRSRLELQELLRPLGMDDGSLTKRVDATLASFMERGLMLRRDDMFLSLALPESVSPRGAGAQAAASSEKAPGRP